MLLSDKDVLAAMIRSTQRLGIDPFVEEQMQPASYDVLLSGEFLWRDDYKVIRPEQDQNEFMRGTVLPEGHEYWLSPGGFVLGQTIEHFEFPDDIAGRIEGKSSLGRCGLGVHITAGFIDPGFRGTLTLEIHNLAGANIVLRPGMRIAQVSFWQMTSPAARPYDGKYQDQTTPTAARAQR